MNAEESTDICEELSKLFSTSSKTDVKFLVQCGQTWVPLVAHKLIVSIWSPVLAEKFYQNNTEDNILEITDVLPSAFHSLLKFMYGSSTELQGKETKFIYGVYKAAEKYQVEKLRKSCTELLISAAINPNNVFEMLDIANHLNVESLKLRCLKLLQYETTDVFECQDLQNITSDMVMSVLKISQLSLSSESDLLTWLYGWFESEYKRTHKTPQTIVEPFLPYLNFTSLEACEFAKLINKHKIFFNENDCFRILMNILDPCPNCVALPSWYMKNKILRLYELKKKMKNLTTFKFDVLKQTGDSFEKRKYLQCFKREYLKHSKTQ